MIAGVPRIRLTHNTTSERNGASDEIRASSSTMPSASPMTNAHADAASVSAVPETTPSSSGASTPPLSIQSNMAARQIAPAGR